jgi:hypothetical protein
MISIPHVGRVGLVASARDEPPRDGERREGQHEPGQTEAQIRRYRAVAVSEQVLERAPRDERCAATEQDHKDGRNDAHDTMYARTDSWLRHLGRPTAPPPSGTGGRGPAAAEARLAARQPCRSLAGGLAPWLAWEVGDRVSPDEEARLTHEPHRELARFDVRARLHVE